MIYPRSQSLLGIELDLEFKISNIQENAFFILPLVLHGKVTSISIDSASINIFN